MARSSGQRDITIGTPIANRTLTELEGIVGFFANTLALRVDLSGDPSFTEVLGRVKQAANGAYAHQDVPFEMVVDAVAPTRSLSYSPLFQVRFALQNANTSLPDPGPGLVLSEIDNDQVTARFDLMVDLWESENGLEGHAEYSTDLFDAETIELLMRRLEALFERLVLDPGQRVFAMDILLPEERERLDALGRGSWPEAEGAGEHRGFMERLREQAEANPDEPAVTCGAETITYEALSRGAPPGPASWPSAAWRRTRWSGCIWSGASISSSPRSRSCGPAVRTCRWTPRIRRRAWPRSWPTHGPCSS